MNESSLKKNIKSAIFSLLQEKKAETSIPPKEEKEEKPKEKPKEKKKSKPGIKIAAGAVGRGSFKKFVREAGARSNDEPKRLMKDLGIARAPNGTDLEKIQQILSVAINFHPAMKEAYLGAPESQEKLPDGKMMPGVAVHVSNISERDGMKFILHTLMGAKNAGYLKLGAGVEIGKGQKSPIFIYSL